MPHERACQHQHHQDYFFEHQNAIKGATIGNNAADQLSYISSQQFSHNKVPSYSPQSPIAPKHITAHLNFDLEHKKLFVKAILTLKNNVNDPSNDPHDDDPTSIKLNAVHFQDVKVTGSNSCKFDYDGEILELWWPTSSSSVGSAWKSNEERQVTIEYYIEDPVTGMYFSSPNIFYPHRPLHAITDHETERCRYWLPLIDFPAYRQTLEFHMTAPKHLTTLANGALVNSTENSNGSKTTVWKLDYPCPPYLICVACGEFVEVEDTSVNNIPIKYFAPKGTPPNDLKTAFDQTPKMIQWLEKKVGYPFPWPKYYQIVADEIRGAMENISLVTWSSMFLMDPTFAKERKFFADIVNIHEMGHTYFGDALVIRHFENAWLKESWATYIESLWIEDHYKEDDFRYEMLCNAQDYISETERYQRPISTRIYDSSWTMFDMHLYPGGAWRIHMLRRLINSDEVFFKAVSAYIQQHAKGVVETDDFRKVLEHHSGLNLVRFFDEWIYGIGHPKVKLNWDWNKDKNTVQLKVTQIQNSDVFKQLESSSSSSSPAVAAGRYIQIFHINFEIELTDSNGKLYNSKAKFADTSQSTSALTTTIQLDKDAKPDLIRLDPHHRLLFELDEYEVSEELLATTAHKAIDVPNRIWAYEHLIKKTTLSAAKSVRKHILQEGFYGVRVKVAEQLAESKDHFHIETLEKLLLQEQHPLAQWQMYKACRFRNEGLRSALKQILPKIAGYRAQAAIYESIGAQRHEEDLQLLLNAAKDDNKIGQHSIVRCGVLNGLGLHQSKEGASYLMTRLEAGKESERARLAVTSALSYTASYQTHDIRQRIIQLLKDTLHHPATSHTPPLLESIIAALSKCATPMVVGELEVMRPRFPPQDIPWLNKQIKHLRESKDGGSEMAKMKIEMEQLQKKVTRLESDWANKLDQENDKKQLERVKQND